MRKKLLTPEEKCDKAYEEWLERLISLHKIAERAYKAQSKLTREAIDVITDRVMAISFGVVRFHGVTKIIPMDIRRKNALYLATEICKDLAMVDIRVADYEFAKELCASCGKPLKAKKKGRK